MKIEKLTFESKVSDVYSMPYGRDLINRLLLQVGKPRTIVTNPIISNFKIKTIAKLAKKYVGKDSIQAFIDMINMEQEKPGNPNAEITHKWWKEAIFYQIYPRSFYDTNGDDIGDIPGIIEKLDYLKDLGVDALWLSPVYDSPNDDNGYDIRDYRKIMKEFGTMEDFDKLLEGVHSRGMKLIMDLVVNHTSDEHEWFQNAINDKNSKYRDYYFIRKGRPAPSDMDEMKKVMGTKADIEVHNGTIAPNNWTSLFAGPAWNYYPQNDEYALHLFSSKQMDLNWDNPDVRKDIIDMINWWLDKGIDGFRMDVINLISKPKGLPDGDKVVGNLIGLYGIEHYFYGPHLHEYLKEIQEKAFAPHNAFSVGETPGLGMQMAKLVTGEERGELNMVFSFDHLDGPGHMRFDDYEYNLNYLRDFLIEWSNDYGNNCWQSLFWNNHDNPKMVSKITGRKDYHERVQKLLAVLQFTSKGTPFVFQGDEMGIANYEFKSMDEITDVEAKGHFKDLLKRNKTPEEAFKMIKAGTREHSRILLPWNENAKSPIVKQQKINENIHEFYKRMIKMRHEHKALVYGDLKVLNKKDYRFVYKREGEGESYLIDCNLGRIPKKAYKPGKDYEFLFSTRYEQNTTDVHFDKILSAYEARVYKKK
ncbi:MAG: alpha-glucosidase [Treponemataceae bacterium]|nr:alpha-glucosidase [Treponemataceae bacterium]